ncbi:hypothetical protein [Streptomyces sp. NPDC088746]|uniref:hypothetical protein n=1 Tax=Streptomyces sp. NPDC088746 TaxID=3365885 RepID=UPI00381A49DB
MPQDEHAACVGVSSGVVKGGVESVAGPGQVGCERVGGEGAVRVRERGEEGERVVVGAGRAAVDDLAVAGQLEEVVGAGNQVGRVHVEVMGEFEQDADGQVGEFFEVDLVLVGTEEIGELPAGRPGGQEAPLDDVRSLHRVAAPLGALAAKATAGGDRLGHRRLRRLSLRAMRSRPR